MKRIIHLSLLILLASCSSKIYRSKVQAIEACNEWASKGIKYTYEKYVSPYMSEIYFGEKRSYPSTKISKGNSRTCIHENETNQFLGYEVPGVKKAHYKEFLYKNRLVKKNFKY
tara:strand:- start:4 stop:345 length:342 start_codon:yes stop_codon:yes gene_type:complete